MHHQVLYGTSGHNGSMQHVCTAYKLLQMATHLASSTLWLSSRRKPTNTAFPVNEWLHHEARRALPYLILEASQCSQIDEDSLIFPHCNVISRHISMQQAHICQGCNDASHLQYTVSVSARPQKSSLICLNVPLYIAYLQRYYS